MNHPAELSIRSFLNKALKGEANVSSTIANAVAEDVRSAFLRQFSGKREGFRLRMSNLGKKKCQLWFEKNLPESKEALPPHFLINMMIGDIIEAVFKGLLRASNVEFEDSGVATLKTKNREIKGEYDMILDGKIDDIKSASGWSYVNKFDDITTLKNSDTFGYVSQLVGYAKATGKAIGGWWVVNKNTGEHKYVEAENIDMQEEMDKIEETIAYIDNDEPFERCYTDQPEVYYGKPSGNRKLGVECGFCDFKHKCWENLKVLPSRVSKAKEPPMVYYTHVV